MTAWIIIFLKNHICKKLLVVGGLREREGLQSLGITVLMQKAESFTNSANPHFTLRKNRTLFFFFSFKHIFSYDLLKHLSESQNSITLLTESQRQVALRVRFGVIKQPTTPQHDATEKWVGMLSCQLHWGAEEGPVVLPSAIAEPC